METCNLEEPWRPAIWRNHRDLQSGGTMETCNLEEPWRPAIWRNHRELRSQRFVALIQGSKQSKSLSESDIVSN